MDIVQIVAFGLIGTILVVLLKQQRPELALQLSIILGVVIFGVIIGKIAAVVDLLKELANKANLNVMYLGTIFKIIGIAYIAEFGAQVCRDAGEGAIAAKLEFAGKVLIMVLAIPIIIMIVETISKMLS
ncbi:MAG TPA: stage III sporulation protein AD [Clostridia bacterium]|jgi:stage III sporulation protein AD|nr:stage III sporulation protein AD [Clostridia bacterium]